MGRFINFICKVDNIKKNQKISKYDFLYITDPWVKDYLKEEDKHYLYEISKGSRKSLNYICPICSTIKKKKVPIYQLIKKHGISCVKCSDYVSFPNKFSYVLFLKMEEMGIIQNYQSEYYPDWVKPYRYRYDNYFEYCSEKYIIEMDGELGHGKREYGNKYKIKDTIGLQRDIKKNELAKENLVQLIRIDATKSDFEYLKNECIKNIACVKINKDKIDWEYIENNCYKNLYKEINDYYMDVEKDINKIATKFKMSYPTIISALKKYNKLGLNDYKTFLDKFKEKYFIVIQLYNDGNSIEEIVNKTKIKKQSVWKYIKRASELNECSYIPSRGKKAVEVYKDGFLINTYVSMSELSRCSLDDLGVKLDISQISNVCNGKFKQAKGYCFKFI